ncbi:TetR/AcrR family transcriptional regulator [Mycolicibacter minnesotensis]
MASKKPEPAIGAEDEVEASIIQAAQDEFSIAGISSTNMDTVARQAGISRATLYRRFPTKYSLLEAVTKQTSKWAAKRVGRLVESAPSPQEAVVVAFTEYARLLGTVPFFQGILDYAISRQAKGHRVIGRLFTKDRLMVHFMWDMVETLRKAGATMPDEDLRAVAEIQARLAMSLVLAPSLLVDMTDAKSSGDFARKYIAPMVY